MPAVVAQNPLRIQEIPVGELRPNDWNPNRMDSEMQHKLREYIRKQGLVEPIVVRRMPDHYQILGGFHRWTICKDELGYTTIPCVVLDIDEKRAKLLTVNLNEMAGRPVEALMAQLIHDLNRDTSLEDLASMLPYDVPDLQDTLDLLKLPDGLATQVDEEAEAAKKSAPTVFTFMVAEHELVERAIQAAMANTEGKNRRGQALTVICKVYLQHLQTTTPVVGPGWGGP